MKRTNHFVMFTLAGLVAIVMIAVLLQSPADWLRRSAPDPPPGPRPPP